MTLRSRVTVAAGVAVAVAIAVASLAAWLVVRAQMYREIDDALETQATAMENRPGPRPTPTGAQPSDDTSDFFTESYLQVLDDEGGVVSSLGERELPVGADERAVATGAATSAVSTVSANGVSVRVYTAATQDGAVQFGRSLAEVEGTLSRLAMALAAVAVAGIGLAAILGRATAAAATAPVQRLSRAAETVARTGDTSHPIEVHGGDELGRLARSFNSMLAALGASIRRQRELVADASHELRTPVASIRTNVEVLQRSGDGLPAEERAEILSEVVATTGEMSLLIADLLEVARHEETSGPADRVRLDEEVLAAVEQSRQTHPTVTVSVDAEQSTVVGTAPRVRRAVLNLVDNAAKWSPPGGTVEVTVRGTTVTVRDHGPGIPPDDLDRVFDRFYRSATARGRPGSGLGLAIVRQVAEDHGGTVEAADTGRGALFTLRLPDPRVSDGGFRFSSSSSAERLMDGPHRPGAGSAAWAEREGERQMTSTTSDQPTDDPPPEVPEPASPRKASARTWVAAGAVAALVVVVGVVMMGGGGGGEADTAGMPTGNDEADAAGFGPAGAPGRGAFGEVTAVAGTTLTVESTDGSGSTTTLSVEATADTVITESLEGTVADLAVGDSVVVIGEDTEAGVAATSVVEGGTALGFGGGGPGAGGALPEGAAPEGFEPPADAQPPAEGEMPDGTDAGDRPEGAPPGGFTAGDIVAIDASGLTVETEDGDQVQVALSSSATVTVSVERSLADIAVGDTIRASGETDGSVVTAEAIQIGTGGMPGAGGGMTPGRSSGDAG